MEEDKDSHGLDYTQYKALQNSGMSINDVVNLHREQSEVLYNNIGLTSQVSTGLEAALHKKMALTGK